MNQRIRLTSALAGFLCIPALVHADAGRALPLTHGIYVDVETQCAEANNSSRGSFWGDQLNSAHVLGHIRDVAAQDGFFIVTVDLEGDSGMGGNLRERTEWKITTEDQEAFTLETEYGTSSYRWCAASM